ncbi:restriction endonuclease subunit S [Cupriavidus gilardii]|nr:restriction endonuclease subunit S [Cupriavidus gilardii]UXC36058.1 restriction endonuclease subunit S [Cupriavidus gilardii]
MTNPNWNWRPLGELFDIGAGKTMSAAARAGADKVPFLRTSNVLWDEIDLTQVDEMSISSTELVDKSLKDGDLLVCEGGEIGRAAVWDGRVPVMSFQNHLHRLRPIQDDVDARFYVYFLQSAFTQLGIFEGAGNKTTIPNLSRNRLAALDVPHPPKPEQQSVAQALAKVREAIAVHDKATSTALELKHAVMNDLFTRGLRGEPHKETEIGPMPESWSPRTILELCEIWSGGTPRKSVAEYWNGDIPWVSGKDLKRPALEDAIDHVSAAGVEAGSRLAPEGAVLLLVRGMGLAKDLPVAVINRPMAFNQDVKALVSRRQYSGQFLRSAIYVGKERLLSQIVPSAHGTMTLNLNDVETFKVACPSDPDEAKDIVTILHTLDRKIDLHRKKREVLEELFESLLHKLMTGEIAVSDLDLSALSPASTKHAEVTA